MDHFTLKVCNHCKGDGTVYLDGNTIRLKDGKYGFKGYSYGPITGTHKCAECGGAGIARYKIHTVGGEAPKEQDIKEIT